MVIYRLQFPESPPEFDAQLAVLLGVPVQDSVIDVALEFLADFGYDFTVFFEKLLRNHWPALAELGITKNELTLWMLYEYDEQCAVEFSAAQLGRIQELASGLSISCWQRDGTIEFELSQN